MHLNQSTVWETRSPNRWTHGRTRLPLRTITPCTPCGLQCSAHHGMEQSSSWESYSRSASPEITHLLWNSKVHGCIHDLTTSHKPQPVKCCLLTSVLISLFYIRSIKMLFSKQPLAIFRPTTVLKYRVSLLSCRRARQFYRKNAYISGEHPVTAAIIRDTTKGTL